MGRRVAGILLTLELAIWRPAPLLFDIHAAHQPRADRTRGDDARLLALTPIIPGRAEGVQTHGHELHRTRRHGSALFRTTCGYGRQALAPLAPE